MTTTITDTPAWVEAMEHHHGPRSGWVTLDSEVRVRDVWHWGDGDPRLTVVVDRHRAGPTSVEVFRFGERVFEVRSDARIDDGQVADALRLAGLLPRMVPAVDRDEETFWLASDGEMFWRSRDANAREGDRQMYVEGVTAC